MRACDLCGAEGPEVLLRSARLDGPLVRCRACTQLEIVHPEVDEAERPWRVLAERERLARVRGVVPSGTLLDVGCSTGTFLSVARECFQVTGVEPDPATSTQAQAKGLDVLVGSVKDVVPPSVGSTP
jgi:2-polyprenyl-3-methyl-5-hydroxy-6-metoxy-1,4-benzoquinol methylase